MCQYCSSYVHTYIFFFFLKEQKLILDFEKDFIFQEV